MTDHDIAPDPEHQENELYNNFFTNSNTTVLIRFGRKRHIVMKRSMANRVLRLLIVLTALSGRSTLRRQIAVLAMRKRALGEIGLPGLFILGAGILSPLALAEALRSSAAYERKASI